MKIDINTKTIQQGVVHLLIEKAEDVPKFSHMYALLCQKLSAKAPNFKMLLLNECNDHFMKRSILSHNVHDENRKIVIKQKIIGLHKFIGELYMLDMLRDKWLYACIQHLLDLNRNESIQHRCDDMEYLNALIRTCGMKLDTQEVSFFILFLVKWNRPNRD